MSGTRSLQSFLNNSLAIRQEIQRFESVHPSIYAIYDLIELIPDQQVAQQIRDHVVCIEGKLFDVISNILNHNFISVYIYTPALKCHTMLTENQFFQGAFLWIVFMMSMCFCIYVYLL